MVFVGLCDGVASNSRVVDLSGNVVLRPLFKKQYYVDVVSDYGNVSGSG